MLPNVIIKHSNPCGFAVGETLKLSYLSAVSTDPISYFGGIVAFNNEVCEDEAILMSSVFLECIIAPSFSNKAIEILNSKKNLRLIICKKDTLLSNTNDLIAKKKYEVADVENLEKFKGQFDMVLCHNVLYHAEDKNKALKNLNECLNNDPNSFCSITTNSEKHMLNVYEIGRKLDKNFPTDRIIDSFTEEIADELLKNHFKSEKKVEEEELRVTDWEILKGFVASGVEPRGIELVKDFYENYKKIYDQEFKQNGYFRIIKRSPLYICKK